MYESAPSSLSLPMPTLRISQKIILSIGMLISLLCSFAVTIAFQNDVSDSISIILSSLLVVAIIAVFATIILEVLESICNP